MITWMHYLLQMIWWRITIGNMKWVLTMHLWLNSQIFHLFRWGGYACCWCFGLMDFENSSKLHHLENTMMVVINMCAGTFKIPSYWEELECDLGSFRTCNFYGFYGMNVLFNAMEMGIYLGCGNYVFITLGRAPCRE